MRRSAVVLSASTLAALGLGLALACGHQREAAQPPPPPLVLAYGVSVGDREALDLRGSVSAQARLRLGFKQAGVVASVLVKEGDAVRPGQVLALLDDSDAKAQVQSAAAALDKAKRDSERSDRLSREGAVATSLRDDAINHLEAAKAQMDVAQEALRRTRLVSTVAGTVYQKVAQPGETLGSGTPVLLLDETGRPVLKVGVTDRDLRRIQEGQAVTLLPEDGGAAFPGRVRSIAPTPAPEDGLYAVELEPLAKRALQSGVLMRVRFAAKAEKAIRIPLDALVRRQDRDLVFVLEGKGAQAKVHTRPIEVGRSEGKELLLSAGLQGGERIVAEGAYFLQDGQAVRVKE